MSSAVQVAPPPSRFTTGSMRLLFLALLGGSPMAMAEPCDCSLPPLPACSQGKSQSTFNLQLPRGDAQLEALQGYFQLRRSLIETVPAQQHDVERRVTQWLGYPIGNISPLKLNVNALDPALSAKLRLVARLGNEVQMANPGTDLPKPGLPVAFGPATPQVLDQSGTCSRPLTDADRLPDGGVARMLVGTDYPEVGRIYYRSSPQADLIGHCSFTLISGRWAVTALHCLRDTAMPASAPQILQDFHSPEGLKRLGFFLAPNGETPLRAKAPCFENQPGQRSSHCPLHRVEVLRALFKTPIAWTGLGTKSPLPRSDLALLELNPKSLPGSVRMAVLSGATDPSGTKTLVASGRTTDPNKVTGHELQVGYIPSGRLSVDLDPMSKVFLWEFRPEVGGTAVCPSDSGGAVFDGWEDGLCRCRNGRPISRPRSLFAVVSYRRTAEETSGCAQVSTSGAIVLSEQRDWICQQAPDLEACKGP